MEESRGLRTLFRWMSIGTAPTATETPIDIDTTEEQGLDDKRKDKSRDLTCSTTNHLLDFQASANTDLEDFEDYQEGSLQVGIIRSLQPDVNGKDEVKAGDISTHNACEQIVTDTASHAGVSATQLGKPKDLGEGPEHSTAEPIVVNLPAPNPSMPKPTPPTPKPAEKKEEAPSDQAKPISEGPESVKTVTPNILLEPAMFERGDPNDTDEQRLARIHAFFEKRDGAYGEALRRKFLAGKVPEYPAEDKPTEATEVPIKEKLAIPPADDSPVSTIDSPTLKRKRGVSPQQKNVQRRL